MQRVHGLRPLSWQAAWRRLGAVGSTMDEARALAEAGAVHGMVVSADTQRAGRGRSGRVWASPPGNLHATVVLRPGGEPQRAPQLGFVVALDRLAGAGTALKWPNDVLRDGAKLAGILLERLENGAVLAGIGANVRHVPPDMPYPVTSLAALGCPAGPEELLGAVMERLEQGWAAWQAGGLAPVLARWSARGPAPGVCLRVRVGAAVLRGRFAGLRQDGALLLEGGGERRAVRLRTAKRCGQNDRC